MVDAYEQQRKAKLKEWAAFVDSIEDRLAQAKEQLGERWLLHPANQVQKLARPYGSAR